MIRWAIICALLLAPIAAMAQTGQQPTYLGLPAKISPPPPPPPPPIIGGAQIHNAPGWLPNHAYAPATGPFTRVNSGPGWNPASGTWNPGQVLGAYQLTSGLCISGAAMPAGTDVSIQDGTCTWKYLSPTDYISITGWTFDNQAWAAGTGYLYGDYVIADSPTRAYEQVAASCTSTVAPAGTAAGSGSTYTTSDGCQWKYWADVLYSSKKSYIPTQRYLTAGSTTGATSQEAGPYGAQLWNDQEYIAGQNGEAVPIRLQAHYDYTQDGFPYDAEGTGVNSGPQYPLTIAAAPGESLADTLTPGQPLTGYDPTKGVAIHNPTSGAMTDGLEFRDNGVNIVGLQIKSDHGIGVGGGQTHGGNTVRIERSIVEGGVNDGNGFDNTAVNLDTAMVLANSLVISHGLYGVAEDYPGFIVHSTLVNPDRVANSAAVFVGIDWGFLGETLSNDAIFGFAHVASSSANPASTDYTRIIWLGGNNVTDTPVGDSGTIPTAAGQTVSVYAVPGTVYGSSADAAFMAAGDWRVKIGGPLAGTGSAFGLFAPSCFSGSNCTPSISEDTPDIIGTARPQNGLYDVGASQGVN